MTRQISTKNPGSQNVFIGIDVHLAQWNVCIIQGGITRKPFQQNPSASCLLQHLKRHFPGYSYYSAYEAGFCGCTIHYELRALGIENIIFNAADISQTNKEKVRKTDSVDAAKIARALYHGELKCIHIPPQWRVADRSLLRLRASQISDIKRQKARMRHFMHTNGIGIPTQFKYRWSNAFLVWIETTARNLGNPTGEALGLMRDSLVRLLQEHRSLNRRLIELMKTERYCQDYHLLRSVPGVGAVTAITLLLECGDLAEFRSADAFCAFVGLVPDSHQSDKHAPRCGITSRRHKILRYMLTECAWRAVAKDSHLSELYATYSWRMARPKAIVKIAHKLAKLIKFVLKNKKAYAPPK